jgi:hypothetical protein
MPDELITRGNSRQFAELMAHFHLESMTKEQEAARRREEDELARETEEQRGGRGRRQGRRR